MLAILVGCRNFAGLDAKTLEKVWKLVYKGCERLLSLLQDELNDDAPPEVYNKRQTCNALKMLVFAFCCFAERFEEQEAAANRQAEVDQLGKGGRKKTKRVEGSSEWTKSKEQGLATLMQINDLKIHRLFTPPTVEDTYLK